MESALRSKGMKLKWISPSLLGSRPFNHAGNVLNESCPSIHPTPPCGAESPRSLAGRVKSSYASEKYASTNARAARARPRRSFVGTLTPLTFWAHLANSSGCVGSAGPIPIQVVCESHLSPDRTKKNVQHTCSVPQLTITKTESDWYLLSQSLFRSANPYSGVCVLSDEHAGQRVVA